MSEQAALQRVQQFLKQYTDLKIILFDSSTSTAELAAQALGVTEGQIAKTLCFLVNNQPIMVVTCGDKRVDIKKLAQVMDVSARKIKFTNPEQLYHFTGFKPGGVSPFGIIQDIPVYLDASLYVYDIVYAAAGTANSALPIAPARLCEITSGNVIDVSQ